MAKKYGYEAYLEDQKKRQKEAEQGKVRYTEAAQASRIQYTLPGYQGKSQNQGKTYQWERDLMGNEKVKGAGNSYTKKFDALTASMGMTTGQAEEFRKFLDFQEDSQHVDPKLNKDKSINQQQSLKYARDARFKTDVIDGILDNMNKTAASKAKKANEVQFEKVTGFDKFQKALGMDLTEAQQNTLQAKELGVEPHFGGKKDKTDPVLKSQWNELNTTKEREDAEAKAAKEQQSNSFLDDILKIGKAGVQDALGLKTPTQANVDIAREYAEQGTTPTDATQEISRGITRAANTAGLGTIKEAAINNEDPYYTNQVFNEREGGAKLADLGYDMAGYLGSGIGSYKAVSPVINKIFGDIATKKISETAGKELLKKLGTEAVRGGAAGAALTGAEVGVMEGLNPENQNWKENLTRVGIGTGLGAVADPLLALGGRAIQGGLGRMAKVDGELPTYTGQASDNVLESLAPTRQGNYAQSSDDLYARLLGQETPAPKQPSMDDFVPESIPTVEEPTSILDELLFGQRGNGPKARGAIDQVPTPRYARETISNMADDTLNRVNQAEGANQRLLDVQQEMKTLMDSRGIYREPLGPNELYTRVRKEGDPETFDDLIKLAELEANKVPVEQDIKSVLRNDPRVAEEIRKLNALGGTKTPQEPQLNGNYGQANLQGIDDILRLLGENPEIVNTSQAPEQALESLIRSEASPQPEQIDNLLMNLDGTMNRPKTATESVSSAPASETIAPGAEKPQDEMLMLLNAQKFSNEADASNSMFSYSDRGEIKDVSSEMKFHQKAYEGLVNRFHKFQVVSDKLMKENSTELLQSMDNKIEAATKAGRTEEVKRLTKEKGLFFDKKGNYRMKDQSPLVQNAENEQAAYMLAEDLIRGTYGNAEKVLEKAGISVADAWEYQGARNLHWQMTKGGHADYQLPKGWDQGRLADVINKWKDNEAIKVFSDSIDQIRVSRLDYLQKSGLKSTDEFLALSENPYYMPMRKDKDWTKSGIELAMKKTGAIGKAEPNVMALGKGDEGYFANPVENIMASTYVTIRNSMRNQTHKEIANLALLDKEGRFIRATDKPATLQNRNVVEVYDNGVVHNYEISPDMADLIKEMRDSEKAFDWVRNITGTLGGLKTTSLSYQLKAIPRDFTQFIVNSDGDPISHIKNLIAATTNPKKAMETTMKEGGAFQNAFIDGMGAYKSSQDMAEQFVQANRLKGGKDVVVNSDGAAKKAGKGVLKALTTPYRLGAKLGNFGDAAPRLAAIKQVEKEYLPAISELEQKIATTSDSFEKQTLTSELNDLKTRFQREKIFRARDVINYSRHGSSGWAKMIKKYWNFANTATQSVDRYARQVKKRPMATIAKTLAVAAPMIGAQETVYQMGSEEDKKIFDDSPDYLKNTMYLFVVNGHRFMFPKPFEVGFVTSPIEGALNLAHTYDEESVKKKAVDGVVNSMRELVPLEIGDFLTLNFSGMSITQPVDEIRNNNKPLNGKPVSFYDRWESEDKKPHFFREEGVSVDDVASKYTSPAAKAFSQLTNTNPDYIEHLIKGYGGDMGKTYLDILDELVKPSETNLKTMTQNANPAQDYLHTQKPSYFWRDAYTDKNKDKSAK